MYSVHFRDIFDDLLYLLYRIIIKKLWQVWKYFLQIVRYPRSFNEDGSNIVYILTSVFRHVLQ